MKLLLRMFKYLLLGFFEVLVIYVLSMVGLGVITVNGHYAPAVDGIDIYIKSNPAHVDIVLPARSEQRDWQTVLPFKWFDPADDDIQYVAFGWGDKGFYLNTPTWADLTAETAIRAVFLPSPTAMHVTLYEHTPREGQWCRKLRISREHYQQLLNFIDAGFELDASGNPMLINADDYPGINDRFFEATGSYSALKTCNVWTNNALKAAGVNTAVWAPLKEAIFYHRNE